MKNIVTQTDGWSPDADGVSMCLWTRRPVCGPRTEVIDRLNALESGGLVEDVAVQTWPDEVALSKHTQHTRVVEAYELFSEWAQHRDVNISPPFEQRSATSLVGRTEDVIRMPMLCLAVYDDGLCGVYPCGDGERRWTVEDYLDAYESASGHPVDAPGASVSATDA